MPDPGPVEREAGGDECSDDDTCWELYQSARRLSKAGQYDAALINYQNAYARKPEPSLLISIGRMYHKLQRFQQAIANYSRYLDLPGEVTGDDMRVTARIYLQQAKRQLEAQQHGAIPERPRNRPQQPIYKRWWFWTPIAVGAAALAVGLGVGLAPRSTACLTPEGVRCFDFFF